MPPRINHSTKFSFLPFVWLAAALLFLCQVHIAPAEIIPDNRLAPWQGNVGVPGGIPNRTVVFKNIVSDLGADPTGVHDCSAIIEHALGTCPLNQVVYIPEGTFKIASFIYMRAPGLGSRTLRGAGMGRTTLKLVDGVNYVIEVGNSGGNGGPWQHAISAGATKGSNTIAVDSTTDFVPGAFMSIQPANPVWAHRLGLVDYNGIRNITVTFRVRNKTSTTLTFDPPCPFDFSGMNPVAIAYDSAPSNVSMPVMGFGIEDMTFDLSGTHAFCAVKFTRTWGCWMKNTEIKGAYSRHVYCDTAVRCEFRGLYHHDMGTTAGPSHEGLDLAGGCSWNLAEDNIFGPFGGAPPIILGDGGGGCAANVFAYNYCFGNSSTGYYDISLNHGAHNMLNLVEGNVIQVYQDDGYFGSCSHNTLFRNKISDQLRLKHMSTYYSIVGNVLGNGSQTLYDTEVNNYWQTGFPFYELGYPNAGNPSYNGTFIEPTDPPDYHLEPWHLQDNNPSGSGPGMQELDRNVKATIIRHGNFDTVHNDVVWDDTISDHTIPPSLYYSSTPSWWPEGIPWPPIGPDLTPMTSEIPAQIRYATISAPGPGHLRVLP